MTKVISLNKKFSDMYKEVIRKYGVLNVEAHMTPIQIRMALTHQRKLMDEGILNENDNHDTGYN